MQFTKKKKKELYTANLTLAILSALRSDQTSHWTQSEVFIDPAGIRLLQTGNKASSRQHSLLYRGQNAAGLVSYSGHIVC